MRRQDGKCVFPLLKRRLHQVIRMVVRKQPQRDSPGGMSGKFLSALEMNVNIVECISSPYVNGCSHHINLAVESKPVLYK